MITLSSSRTFFIKFCLPGLWAIGWTLACLNIWQPDAHDKHGVPIPLEWKLGFTAIGVLGMIIWVCSVGTYKRVRVRGNTLYVSNFLREIELPTAKLSRVSSVGSAGRRTIRMRTSEPTAFGSVITFQAENEREVHTLLDALERQVDHKRGAL